MGQRIKVKTSELIAKLEGLLAEAEDRVKNAAQVEADWQRKQAAVKKKNDAALLKTLKTIKAGQLEYTVMGQSTAHVYVRGVEFEHVDFDAPRRQDVYFLDHLKRDLAVLKMHADEFITIGVSSEYFRYVTD